LILMTKLQIPTILTSLIVTAGCAATGAPAPISAGTESGSHGPSPNPRNVIIFIGDGVGAAYWSAARIAAGTLAVEEMRVMGLTDTRSDDSRVTDSAAAATALAAGIRTYNGAIGVGSRCRELFLADSARVMSDPAGCDPLESVFDIAFRSGIGTGLVATSSVTHATPAAFGARVPYRRMQPEIARQLAAAPIDVLLGGGRGFFDGTLRPDSADLLSSLCATATCLMTPTYLRAYRADDRRLIGLFAENQMTAAGSRSPTLPEMTGVALAHLGTNPQGFVLMVEGSQPDWRGHDNAPLADVTREMLDFDQAISVGLDFAHRNPETLVLVVADHETGGHSIVEEGGVPVARYTAGGHTGETTPHFATGPGADRFSGIRDNDEIGRILLEIVSRR
jgi:alkaline phosphatase